MAIIQYCLVVSVICHYYMSSGHVITTNEVANDRVLKFVMMVNRHGERTPDEEELSLSDIQEKLLNITMNEGFEALTKLGRRRAYQIGKFIRQRYGPQGHNLLSNLYLKREIFVRSTDKDRTKMTALVAMAALYPPEREQQWDEGLGKVWQPVPYSAVPLAEDYLRFYSNCEYFKVLMAVAKMESLNEDFRPYNDLIPLLKQKTGRNFTENPLLFQTLFDLFRSQSSLGFGIPEWAEPYLPRLAQAAKMSYKQYFRTDEMKKIGGGVLLNEFVEAADLLAAGLPVYQPFRMFSAHDFNLGALMEVTGVMGVDSIPEYGAVFALELYQSKRTGQFSVLPVYLPQAGDSVANHLNFADYDEYCELEKFKDMTREYLLPEKRFYRVCDIKTEL